MHNGSHVEDDGEGVEYEERHDGVEPPNTKPLDPRLVDIAAEPIVRCRHHQRHRPNDECQEAP